MVQSQRNALEAIEGHLKRYNALDSPVKVQVGNDAIKSARKSISIDETLQSTKRFFLILHDVSKKNNCGTLIRSASAFGCSGIIVRAKRRSDVATFGAHGADKHLPFYFVPAESDVFDYAKQKLNCRIVGVEIKDSAISINQPEFQRLAERETAIAFVLGNEGTGMHPQVSAKCDEFVYIPHYGGGTASLNVAVAGSIIFQRYASLAQFSERSREGEKFIVDKLDAEMRKNLNSAEAEEKRKQRQSARLAGLESGTDALDVLHDDNGRQSDEDNDVELS